MDTLIELIPSLIGLVSALLLVYVTWKSHTHGEEIKKNRQETHQIYLSINSRVDQLIAEIRKNVLAIGIAEGRNQVHDEQKRDKNGH